MKKNERRIVTFNADPDVQKELELKTNKGQRSDLINKLLRKSLGLAEVEVMEVANSKRYQNIKEVRDFVSECKFIDATHLTNKMSLRLGVTKKKIEEYIALLIDEKMLFSSFTYILDKDYYAECLAKNKPLPGSPEFIWASIEQEKEKMSDDKADAFLNL